MDICHFIIFTLLISVALALEYKGNNSRGNSGSSHGRYVGSRTANYSPFQTNHCPPGFIVSDSGALKNVSSLANATSCKCVEDVKGVVNCANVKGSAAAFILGGHCMTYDELSDSVAISDCVFSCQVEGPLLDGRTDYYLLPTKFSQLEETMCGKVNREGYQCSECRPGYMPPAYSYSPECVPCDLSGKELAKNWMKYLALAILPQSAVFLLMAVFRVGLTRPPWIGMIQIFQAITTPMYLQAITRMLTCASIEQSTTSVFVLRLVVIFYGFFNLDFFRILSPEFCLNLDIMQLLLLEYASAFWPLLLIIVAYLLIELYMRGCSPVVWAWKPVKHCLNRCKKEWHPKSSLIETFASFFVLSWMKLLSISSSLITIDCISNISSDGTKSVDCMRLYSSPNMKFFSREHLIFGTSAFFVFLIFILLPLALLIIYPLKFFHRLLNWCGLHCQALHIFMDSFQGSLRDGTDGAIDCRWFSSCYLIMRIMMVVFGALWNRLFFPIASVVLIGLAIVICTLQPYKRPAHNVFDVAQILILAAFYASHGAVSVAQFASTDQYITFSIGLTFSLSVLPLAVSIGYSIWWILKVKQVGTKLGTRFRQWKQQRQSGLEDSLPDRLNNPCDYVRMETVAGSIQYEEYTSGRQQ